MDDHQRKMWAAMLGEIGEYRAVGGLPTACRFAMVARPSRAARATATYWSPGESYKLTDGRRKR